MLSPMWCIILARSPSLERTSQSVIRMVNYLPYWDITVNILPPFHNILLSGPSSTMWFTLPLIMTQCHCPTVPHSSTLVWWYQRWSKGFESFSSWKLATFFLSEDSLICNTVEHPFHLSTMPLHGIPAVSRLVTGRMLLVSVAAITSSMAIISNLWSSSASWTGGQMMIFFPSLWTAWIWDASSAYEIFQG